MSEAFLADTVNMIWLSAILRCSVHCAIS